MPILKDAMQAVMKKAIALAPDSFIPGGRPDPLINHKHGLIGASISRIDGPLKVSGRAAFAAEFPLEGMTYAALRYSSIPRGRIVKMDTDDAQAAPGVVLVMTYRNAPRLKPMPAFMPQPKAAGGDDLPIMQDDQVHWNGQPVALVLADTQEQADYAQSLIRISYEADSDAVTSLEAAKAKGSEPGVFQGEPLKLEINDAEAMLAAAPHRIDARYTTPRHNHNPIELHAATLAWEGDTLRIHDTVQAVAHEAWCVPYRRRPYAHRAARRFGRSGRRHAGCADPHGDGRDDAAQQHAGAVHSSGEERLCVPQFSARCGDRQNEHDSQHVHARARRGSWHVRA